MVLFSTYSQILSSKNPSFFGILKLGYRWSILSKIIARFCLNITIWQYIYLQHKILNILIQYFFMTSLGIILHVINMG